ncbi:MAG: DinB family protein [Saprospiraceae bacterium]|nr:DinB family protein [Lewinella sp.]
MATFYSEQLLDQLAADVRQILLQTESLKTYSSEVLRQQPQAGSWSVTEVLAHLNYYARFYIDAMETQLNGHQTQPQEKFQPGWFGNYFTKVIGPSSDGQVRNKMSSPADSRPLSPESLDPQAELQEFIDHQHQVLNLLKIARSANLGKIRVPISLTRFIRLKLGDTFRFVIAHEQRHFQQIARVADVVWA